RQRSVSVTATTPLFNIDVPSQLIRTTVGSDVVLWDLATGHERLRLPGYPDVQQMAISPDGSRLVLGKGPRSTIDSSELTLLSLKSGRRLSALRHLGTIATISFSPDGNRLVGVFSQSSRGASGFKPIQIWDATPLPEEPAAK